MSDRDKFLDELLDRSLSNHVKAEPLMGLEQRILAKLAHEQAEPVPSFSLSWRWAGVMATVVLVGVMAWVVNRDGRQSTQPQTTPQTQQAISPAPYRPLQAASAPVANKVPIKQKLLTKETASVDSWSEVFPTPSPLTEQERLLLQYLQKTPNKEIVANAKPDELALPAPEERNELNMPGDKSGDVKNGIANTE